MDIWGIERPAFLGGWCPVDQAPEVLRQRKGSTGYSVWETPHAIFSPGRLTGNTNTLRAGPRPARNEPERPIVSNTKGRSPLFGEGAGQEGRAFITVLWEKESSDRTLR